MTDLERCLTFLRRLDERCAEESERFAFGTAYRCPTLPRVWSLNYLSLDRGADPRPEDVLAEADRLLAGFAHRKAVTDDDGLGSRLAASLGDAGWRAVPLLVMPHAGAGRDVPAAATVREVAFDALVPAWVAGMERADWGDDDEAVRQAVGQRRVIGRAGRARYFTAFADGAVASYCELYTDGETGQVEGVLTLPAHRGRGLASAVVTRAVEESRRAGHTLTFLLAEQEDWPKELYAKLGFRTAGRIWDFLRPPPAR